MSIAQRFHLEHRARIALMGTSALFVAVVATAFAVGGSSSPTESAGAASSTYSGQFGRLPAAVPSPPGVSHGSAVENSPVLAAAPALAPEGSSVGSGTSTSTGSTTAGVAGTPTSGGATASDAASSDSGSSVAATKIVKNGELTVRVDKTKVQSVVGQLSTLATTEGGYVSSSNTNTGGGEQSGEVVLRIPAAHFTDAINKASAYGKVLSLTTSADDVTGRYVDLAAREHALVQTRATYLTILGRARTIGATLEVQDRIEGVQSQIEQLQGQLKVLGNQAAYSTLTVDVTPVALMATVHHARHGLSKAWHKSWSRFDRGIDGIVSAIGPILLALLILAALAAVGVVGYRGVRRVTS
jgi:hypothetical protein